MDRGGTWNETKETTGRPEMQGRHNCDEKKQNKKHAHTQTRKVPDGARDRWTPHTSLWSHATYSSTSHGQVTPGKINCPSLNHINKRAVVAQRPTRSHHSYIYIYILRTTRASQAFPALPSCHGLARTSRERATGVVIDTSPHIPTVTH